MGKERSFALQILPLAAAFAFIGALPWIAERFNPPSRYADQNPASLYSQIAEQTEIPTESLKAFASQPQAVISFGRLLYPRTFGGNAGLTSATPWPSYAPRDYPRLGFKLFNEDVREVVFPNKGVSIQNVHAWDVVVLGCQRENYIEARLLFFPAADLTYLSDRGIESCSE